MSRFRSILLAAAGFVGALVTTVSLAFFLSPWPSALLISMAFAGNDAASEAALERHVPPGLRVDNDLVYGAGQDEIFDLVRPDNAQRPWPLILWIHGGGFIGGSKDGVANYLKILAANGYAVAGMNYSTAPGSTYPTPLRQVSLALEHLVNESGYYQIDPNRIVLVGDSAGAQIAAQSANIIVNPDYAGQVGLEPAVSPTQLRGTVLVSGAFDMTNIDVAGGLEAWFIKTVLWSYSGIRNFMDDDQFRLASITPNVTASFPPTFISSGDEDPLEPQARALASRLEELGVTTTSLFFDVGTGLQHEYQFDLDTPEGQSAYSGMVGFLENVTE